MSTKGIHFMALSSAKQRLAANEQEMKIKARELDEAIKLRDLRENSEYDEARNAIRKLTKERDALIPVLGMPVIASSDALSTIEEGSIVKIVVYSVTPTPVTPGSAAFAELKTHKPAFEGVLMYGATLPIHELLQDKALSVDTPVGRYLLGKQPGDYSIPVRGGFSNVSAEKLSSKTPSESLYCKL